MRIEQIKELQLTGRRLGRHIQHDPQSWLYPAPMSSVLKSVRHKRMIPVFDQGDIGDCTANAALGMLGTEPFYTGQRIFNESDCITLYEDETRHDGIAGVYPPDDTGSTGLASMKALKRAGYIKSYQHMFSLDHLLRTLVLKPVCIGINWYTGFDTPLSDGEMSDNGFGQLRGGHEIVVDEIDTHRELVWITNSWGPDWGMSGRASFSWSTLKMLLGEGGDAVTGTI